MCKALGVAIESLRRQEDYTRMKDNDSQDGSRLHKRRTARQQAQKEIKQMAQKDLDELKGEMKN